MQPAMLLKLLRKLTIDVSKLSEYTTVALRVNNYHKRQHFLMLHSFSFSHCIMKDALSTTVQQVGKDFTAHHLMKKSG